MNKLLEAAGLALSTIWASKLRSFMTVLGNIVAVTSIIAVVSLIQGLNAAVQEAILSQAGADSFSVQQFPIVFSEDDFDRALLHIGETSDAVADGLRLIQQRFNNLLEAQGVTGFESEGEVFDPEIHEAMTMIDGDEEQSGTVYSEYRRGYLMNGKLLRPARVAVLR